MLTKLGLFSFVCEVTYNNEDHQAIEKAKLGVSNQGIGHDQKT